jgi:hypothetical protein
MASTLLTLLFQFDIDISWGNGCHMKYHNWSRVKHFTFGKS